ADAHVFHRLRLGNHDGVSSLSAGEGGGSSRGAEKKALDVHVNLQVDVCIKKRTDTPSFSATRDRSQMKRWQPEMMPCDGCLVLWHRWYDFYATNRFARITNTP